MEDVSLKPWNLKRDEKLIKAWLCEPHVERWWGDPQKAWKELLAPAAGGGGALIMFGKKPVGLLRWQIPGSDELAAAGLNEFLPGTLDIDIAIGEPDFTGRAIGPKALRLLAEKLFKEKAPPEIMLCTSVENTRAIRAYEKAGFRRIRRFFDPGLGTFWLFTVRQGSHDD
jgi:aminoglycoside 6'-N-acetyltransferase